MSNKVMTFWQVMVSLIGWWVFQYAVIVLKLMGRIECSWWIVLAPVGVPTVILVLLVLGCRWYDAMKKIKAQKH